MTIKYTVTSPRRNPSPLLAPIAHGSQITVISALNTPTVVVPSPPAGRLRFVNPGAGYPTGGAGAMANIWWANDSGGDVEAFYSTIVGAIREIRDGGAALKAQVVSAADAAAVAAVEDSR